MAATSPKILSKMESRFFQQNIKNRDFSQGGTTSGKILRGFPLISVREIVQLYAKSIFGVRAVFFGGKSIFGVRSVFFGDEH